MIVKNLIAELLDYPMDAEVELEIETDEENESLSDFVIEERGYSTRWVSFVVKPNNKVLVDEAGYQSLKDENSHYEDRIAELENAAEVYEQQIQELEHK